MDLEKLKNIDFQNIDVNKLLEALLTKKDLFVSVIIGAVALFVTIGLVRNFFTEMGTLNTEITGLKAKIEVIKDYDSADRRVKKFIKAAPKSIEEDLFSSTVAEIAATEKVNIVSFIPAPKKEDTIYNSVGVSIDVEAPDYPQLISFLKALAKAPFSLRIDNCSISTQTKSSGNMGTVASSKMKTLAMHLDLSSVEIKK